MVAMHTGQGAERNTSDQSFVLLYFPTGFICNIFGIASHICFFTTDNLKSNRSSPRFKN